MVHPSKERSNEELAKVYYDVSAVVFGTVVAVLLAAGTIVVAITVIVHGFTVFDAVTMYCCSCGWC